MAIDINLFSPRSGRVIKEDNTVVNEADGINADGSQNVQIIGSITPTHSILSVTTSSQTALDANANRKYAMFINDSDTAIYLKLGATAVANQGIRLNPNGGSFELSSAIGNLYTGAIHAIHGSTGNKNLLITEGV